MSVKREQLIDTALTLFYEKGVNCVGINEVLSASGVAKKTLYNHFKSKEDLVIATLETRHNRFMQWLQEILESADTPQTIITSLFEGLTDWFTNQTEGLMPFRGCFFINTAAEYGERHIAIAAYCRRHKAEVKHLFRQKLGAQNEELVDLVCLLKEGAIVSAYVSHDTQAARRCIPIALMFLNTLRH